VLHLLIHINLIERGTNKMITEISNKQAQSELWTIEFQFDRAEDLRDNPGRYFPAIMVAEEAMEDWQLKYPEADKERRYIALIEAAENKERLAKEANCYGESESREDRIASFTAQAIELRNRAAELVKL